LPLKNKGAEIIEDPKDQRYYAVYWQNFIMQSDSGINRKIYRTPPKKLDEYLKDEQEA
jgi:hypothetical protein